MIIKIDLSQIYSMNGKVILGNKYRRAEGNLFETGYSAVTIATGSKGNNVFSSGSEETVDRRVFYQYEGGSGIGSADRYSNATWGLKIFYEIIRCEVAHSTSDPVMETKTSDFYVNIVADTTKNRITHLPSPIPSMYWELPDAPAAGTGSAAMYSSAAKSLLGKAAMTVVSADYYNAVVDVGVITKVEVWQNYQLSEGGHLTYYDPFTGHGGGSVKATHQLSSYTFSVFNNTFMVESNPYEFGATEKKYVYKYPDNWLITEKSTYTDNNGRLKALIENLFENIISNYRNGKQVVKLAVSEGSYKDTNNNKLTNHIFEVGQYIKLYDDTTPIIYYKLSNVCKVFEITECEYLNEQWNLILKEVAQVEPN